MVVFVKTNQKSGNRTKEWTNVVCIQTQACTHAWDSEVQKGWFTQVSCKYQNHDTYKLTSKMIIRNVDIKAFVILFLPNTYIANIQNLSKSKTMSN